MSGGLMSGGRMSGGRMSGGLMSAHRLLPAPCPGWSAVVRRVGAYDDTIGPRILFAICASPASRNC